MTLYEIYLVVSSLLLLGLAVIWNNSTWLNFSMKVMLFIAAIVGAYITLSHFFPNPGVN